MSYHTCEFTVIGYYKVRTIVAARYCICVPFDRGSEFSDYIQDHRGTFCRIHHQYDKWSFFLSHERRSSSCLSRSGRRTDYTAYTWLAIELSMVAISSKRVDLKVPRDYLRYERLWKFRQADNGIWSEPICKRHIRFYSRKELCESEFGRLVTRCQHDLCLYRSFWYKVSI